MYDLLGRPYEDESDADDDDRPILGGVLTEGSSPNTSSSGSTFPDINEVVRRRLKRWPDIFNGCGEDMRHYRQSRV